MRVKASLGVSPLRTTISTPSALHAENHGVGSGHDGRRVDDDEFEFGAQFGDRVGEAVRRKQVGRIWRQRARRNRREIRNRGMLHGDEIEARNAGEIGAEAGVLVAVEIEKAANTGLAKVGVDEQRAIAKLRERDGEIRRGGRFAFAGQSAGDENHLRRMTGLREEQRGAESAERFGHLRLRQMLRDKLDMTRVTRS